MSAVLKSKPKAIVCDGNEAAAWAVTLARVDMVAVYPITPQSSLVEYLAKFVADGRNCFVIHDDGDPALIEAVRKHLEQPGHLVVSAESADPNAVNLHFATDAEACSAILMGDVDRPAPIIAPAAESSKVAIHLVPSGKAKRAAIRRSHGAESEHSITPWPV